MSLMKCGSLLGCLTMMIVACSDPRTAPTQRPALGTSPSRSAAVFDLAPASLAWHQRARELVAANSLSPLAAARVYAALSVAQFRAVAGTDDVEGIGGGGRDAVEAHRGAVAGASAQVLSFFFPAAATSLESLVSAQSDGGPGRVHPAFVRGLATGRGAGDAMVDRTKNDHFTAPWTGTIPVGPGKWIANGPPAGATLSGVTPYLINSADQFRPPPPPTFGSAAFLTDLQEIRQLSDTRTAEQRAIALQWNYGGGTFTPPGYWDLVTANYVETYGLDERAATHAFAMMAAATMDALIGCWDAKFTYWFIRPPQADPGITLVFALPNHPSYPSGHSCGSAAAASVLSYLFPDRASELSGWVAEAGLSRMYAGIHYRFDITAGQALGNAVGRWVIAKDQNPGLLAALR